MIRNFNYLRTNIMPFKNTYYQLCFKKYVTQVIIFLRASNILKVMLVHLVLET